MRRLAPFLFRDDKPAGRRRPASAARAQTTRWLSAWARGASGSSAIALVALFAAAVLTAAEPPAPWPQWRGPNRDGTAPAFQAPRAWPQALTERWRAAVGLGHASPVVAAGRVFVHARRDEREVVTALDQATGKPVWTDSYDAPYRLNPAAAAHGPGPKSTPAVDGGTLYTFGISGILTAYDASTGKVRWRVRPVQDQPDFGTAMSPLVDGTRVIVHVGGRETGALTAFDGATGDVGWRWTGGAPAYASPVIATFHGERQIVTQSRTHVVGLDASDGRLLWEIPFTTAYDQNSVTPVIAGDLVVYSGLASGTAAVRPVRANGGWRADPVWKTDEVSLYMSTPVVERGMLFGLSHRNRGQFFALDVKTGKALWTTRGREADNAALVTAGGVLLALTTPS